MAGSIATYNRKRDFRKTAEPPGKITPRKRGKPVFVVQKHDASRLHYDFRLEIGGVLCSWAVPKGPSLDPGEKRLAVRTEDHPLEYGHFEGIIPAKEYGGGTVMLWDRGTFTPLSDPDRGLRKGELKFELRGERLRGGFVLARMRRRGREKGENWLLIKHRDEAARPGSKDAVVRDETVSVASGRDMNEIATGDAIWHSHRPVSAAQDEQDKEAAPMPRTRRKIARLDVAKLAGARKARMPASLSPQLATLIETPPAGRSWISEIKFDGYRMLARLDNGEVKLFSRNNLPWEKKLPAIVQALGRLKVDQAWLDGEIVALDEGGHSSFSLLKAALGDGGRQDIFMYLFDILYLDGYSTLGCRQDDRKALLESVLGDRPPAFIRYSEHMAGLPAGIQQRACEMGLEGIIVKDAAAAYSQRRTRAWLKLKCIQREEFVVIGYTDPQGTRAGLGALHLGYYDRDGALHYAGGVGTGYSTKMLLQIEKTLSAMARKVPPAVWIHGEEPPRRMHWVRPEMVVETQFIDWTAAGSLRHAVFLGIREDKDARDVVRDPPTAAVSRYSGKGSIVRAAKKSPAKPKAASRRQVNPPKIIDRRPPEGGPGGGVVRLTHPDRLLWPDDGLTKQDLAAYWVRAAQYALPYVGGRPLALVRTPDGITGETFFQKKLSRGFPRQVLDVKVGGEQVIAIQAPEGFQALAQMSAIEIHPWGTTVEHIERPDLMVMDLDPGPGLEFDDVVSAARDIRDALQSAGLKSFCKTTGGKGLHVVVPLRPESGWDEVKDFAKSIARSFARAEPRRFTDTMAKKLRRERIFIDYLRNGRGATAIAPFSPRARPGATIAMPLKWSQVRAGLDPGRYTIRATERVLRAGATAWRGFFDIDQEITDRMRRAFAAT